MRVTLILLFLMMGYFGNAQQNKTLDSLLLRAFNSKDSSWYFLKVSKPIVKTKADTANYKYFQFMIKDRLRENDSTLHYAQIALASLKPLDSFGRMRKVYERLHFQELRAGRYDKALEYNQKTLDMAEIMKDTAMISLHLSDKSIIYHDFEDYDKGVRFGKDAYGIMDQAAAVQYKYLIFANNAIAINFDDWGKADSALYYHFKNVELLSKVDDSLPFTFIFNNIGNTYLKQKRFKESRAYISKALELNKRRGRSYNLATNYTNLATIAYEMGDYQTAKKEFVTAYEYARDSESIEKLRDVVQQEAWFYKRIGDFEKALERQEAFYELRDSVFNTNRAAKFAEMETRYQTEQKEKALAETRANLAERELEVRRKNFLMYGGFSLALILGLMGYLFYNQQRLKNRQLQKENELKTALAKIETQNKLQEQRLRISRDLHDNIGSQLTFIISSLDNIKFGFKDISEPLTTKLSSISAFTSETIYELRDTIWAMNKSKITVEDLQSRISNFIEKASTSSEHIQFDFKVANEISSSDSFTSVEGMNIYRIIQEAVNNALKYSNCKTIEVAIGWNQPDYSISITDDGTGFDGDDVTMGNGINNMRKRARELGGELQLSSSKENGTNVSVKFPKS